MIEAAEIDINVVELKKSLQHFNWIDYVVFVFMLISSALIGVYYGFIHKSNKVKRTQIPSNGSSEVAQEYLLGSRQMSVVPVAMSLVASWISGISLLGLTTEMYLYGTSYVFVIVTLTAAGIITSYVYLPVFHDLRLNSCYQYLEKRFDKRMRLFGSILYTLHTVTFLPVVIYVPALAFNQVTGVNIHVVTPFVCVICIFYTLVGGIKAVVWTDCFQTFIMVGTMLVIIVKGTIDVSGLDNIWQQNWNTDRLMFPELSFDLTLRHSFLALMIGGTPYFTYTFVLSQSMIQRYLALPTLKDAKNALVIYVSTIALLIVMCCFTGLIVYTKYSNCDPLKTKLISSPDQLLPLLVMEVLGSVPGMPGLFVAGIFSAALSSLSTCLNAMASVVLEDFYRPFVKQSLTEKQTSYLMRGVVLIIGIISVALVFVVERLGTVLQLQMSIAGVTTGPIFGVFTMGVLMPWIKRKGAFYGGVSALIAMSWILFQAQNDIASGHLTFPRKYLHTDDCSYNFVSELSENSNQTIFANEGDNTFKIHHMSYLYYTVVGALFSILVGTVVSFFRDVPLESDPMLFSPVIRKFFSPPKNLLPASLTLNDKDCVIHAFEMEDNKLQ